jgi:hypothetical protein
MLYIVKILIFSNGSVTSVSGGVSHSEWLVYA